LLVFCQCEVRSSVLFLCLSKQEIVNYLIEEQIPYVTDSTNLTDEYTRNKLRHQVLPSFGRAGQSSGGPAHGRSCPSGK